MELIDELSDHGSLEWSTTRNRFPDDCPRHQPRSALKATSLIKLAGTEKVLNLVPKIRERTRLDCQVLTSAESDEGVSPATTILADGQPLMGADHSGKHYPKHA